MTPVKIERHDLGPRLHVLGRRIHECHLGLGLAAGAVFVGLLGGAELLAVSLACVAAWLVAKDWRDLHPATRDTAAWAAGVHRRPDGPPAPPARDRVPALAAVATALAGAINLASVMTSDLPARARALLALIPAADVRLAHAVALPAGLALVALAWPLARRRRGALHLAVGLLAGLGVLNVLKGLDIEPAIVSWGVAVVLWRSRAAFWVRHERRAVGRALRLSAGVLGAAALAGVATVALGAGHARVALPLGGVPEAALSLLTLTGGPAFRAPFAWLPQALGILGVGAAGVAAANLLAPLRPRGIADAVDRRRAAALVRRHGTDTLSAFKLRRDLARRFSPEGNAVTAYRVEAGAMLIAGDPVGPDAALEGVVDDLVNYSRRHGLALGVVGASDRFAAVARRAGMRRVYLGDEAILPAAEMDLSGGEMKSLRKAVNRVRRHGFTASLHEVGALDHGTLEQLRAVSMRWRDGARERGFSMSHDQLVDELLPDAVVVLATDEHGQVRGFLHFVPVFGRAAVSLAFMRRDRDTPNGLTDFLVVEAARLLGDQGVEEFSLNFAAFGRWLRDPGNVFERRAAWLLHVADRWFQVERLLSFNAKFRPRWQPRYLLVARPSQLPRIALASMFVEGQLPRPRLDAVRRRRIAAPVAT